MSRPVTLIGLHGPAPSDLHGWLKAVAASSGEPCRTLPVPWGNFAALNQAIASCPEDDVVLAVDQVSLETDRWLAPLRKLAEEKNAGVVGAKLYDRMGLIYSCGRLVIHRFGMFEHISNIGYGQSDMALYDKPVEADSVIPWLCFIRRDALNTLGRPPFEEGWTAVQGAGRPPWMESDDLCLSLREKGFSVWTEPSVTLHHPRTDTFAFMQQTLNVPSMGEMAMPMVNLWNKKWRWNPAYPDLHAIRALYGETPLCWRIGKRLLDEWESPEPPVDLLMVTRNNLALLKTTLECVAKTAYPAARLKILLNGSTDGSKAYLEELRNSFPFPIEIAESPVNVGLTAGLNWLSSLSDAPLVARLDDDIEMEPDWLAKLVAALRANPYAGAVGTKVVDIEKPDTLLWADYRMWPDGINHQTEKDGGQYDYLSRTLGNMGCMILYRQKAYRAAGPLDIALSPISWEDLDHQIALWAAGYDVLYEGRVAVKHPWKPLRDHCRRSRGSQVGNGMKSRYKWGTGAFQAIDRGLDLAGRRASAS